VVQRPRGDRTTASVTVKDREGHVIFEGTSKDERFDANDHLTAVLPEHRHFDVHVQLGDATIKRRFDTHTPDATITIPMNQEQP
jgi:hypothetical protein